MTRADQLRPNYAQGVDARGLIGYPTREHEELFMYQLSHSAPVTYHNDTRDASEPGRITRRRLPSGNSSDFGYAGQILTQQLCTYAHLSGR